jgi:hypothetical protein
MEFKIKLNWMSVAKRVRILLILGAFWFLSEYMHWPTIAWIVVLYFLFSDVSDIEDEIESIKGDREQWRDFLINRKRF